MRCQSQVTSQISLEKQSKEGIRTSRPKPSNTFAAASTFMSDFSTACLPFNPSKSRRCIAASSHPCKKSSCAQPPNWTYQGYSSPVPHLLLLLLQRPLPVPLALGPCLFQPPNLILASGPPQRHRPRPTCQLRLCRRGPPIHQDGRVSVVKGLYQYRRQAASGRLRLARKSLAKQARRPGNGAKRIAMNYSSSGGRGGSGMI